MNEREATKLYLERSEVRSLLIGQPDESLHITEEILREVDALPILTAADIACVAQAVPGIISAAQKAVMFYRGSFSSDNVRAAIDDLDKALSLSPAQAPMVELDPATIEACAKVADYYSSITIQTTTAEKDAIARGRAVLVAREIRALSQVPSTNSQCEGGK